MINMCFPSDNANPAHGDANSDYYLPNEAEQIDELGRANFFAGLA